MVCLFEYPRETQGLKSVDEDEEYLIAYVKNWLVVVILSVERRVAMLRGCYINSAC